MDMECKVVFLDRDGVINKRPPVHEYVSTREELIILPGVAKSIRRLNEAGLFVFVISNQRGIDRGIMTLPQVEDIHDYLNECLKEDGAHIDKFYICPHGDGVCECRKPKPGLLIQAEKDLQKKGYKVDKNHSVMIGDADTDIAAGEAYGVESLLIGGDYNNLEEAVNYYFERIYE